MKYEYTYDPLEGRHNDRTYRKECIDEMQGLQIRRAGPEWVLDELALGEYGSGYEMCCPNCDGTMVEKSKYNKS